VSSPHRLLGEIPAIARRMLREMRLDVLVEYIVREAARISGAARARLVLIDAGRPQLVAAYPSDDRLPPSEQTLARSTPAIQALVAAVVASPDRAAQDDLVALPLLSGQELEGVLLLECGSECWSAEVRDLFISLAAIAIDQTQRYAQLEAEAVERAHELSQSLEQLRHMQDQLVQAEKLSALAGVIAGVTHEMSTPIGNALVVATTLKVRSERFADNVVAGQLRRSTLEEFVSMVAEAGDLIDVNLRTASSLLTQFKGVAADQISERRRMFDLGQVLEELVWTFTPQFRNTFHRVELDVAPGILVESYPGPLGQVIGNLLQNALQHGFEGVEAGLVMLRASCDEPHYARITFSDNGVGISKQHLHRVFEPFFTTRLGSGGTGLGLSLSYSIVTRILGGQMRVESHPGSGTTFTIDLPLVAPHHSPEE
jgi:signal transduction histidine kinase